MDTTETNKLIAEFMGWNKGEKYSEKYPFYDAWNEPIDQILPSEMLFNKSWDWLMSVVEKIESIKVGNIKYIDFHIMPDAVIITNQEDEENPLILINKSECKGSIETEFTFFETKIQAVYTACVEFIKWYNDQQSNDNLASTIYNTLGINIVTCGDCGAVNLHKAGLEEITCEYCNNTSDICDFPDLFDVVPHPTEYKQFAQPVNKKRNYETSE